MGISPVWRHSTFAPASLIVCQTGARMRGLPMERQRSSASCLAPMEVRQRLMSRRHSLLTTRILMPAIRAGGGRPSITPTALRMDRSASSSRVQATRLLAVRRRHLVPPRIRFLGHSPCLERPRPSVSVESCVSESLRTECPLRTRSEPSHRPFRRGHSSSSGAQPPCPLRWGFFLFPLPGSPAGENAAPFLSNSEGLQWNRRWKSALKCDGER